MRANLKRQFINRISESQQRFYAAFKHKSIGDYSINEKLLFEPFKFESGDVWSATVIDKTLRFNVGKVNNSSVHLYSYVSGFKVSCVLPLSHLLFIQPIDEKL